MGGEKVPCFTRTPLSAFLTPPRPSVALPSPPMVCQSSSEAWTESWRAEQRRLVAEFGLLDAQLAVLLDVLEGATQKKSAAPSGGVPSPARGPPGNAPGSSGASEGSEGSDEWREFVGLAAPGAGAVPASEEAWLLAKDLELVDELVDWDELLLARIDPDELDVVASQVRAGFKKGKGGGLPSFF